MFNRRDTGVSKAIIKGRDRQEKLTAIRRVVSDNRALQRYTNFETRSNNLVKASRLSRIQAGLEKMDQAKLATRRSRLAQLLKQDEALYQEEIDMRVETMDQKKERMAKRAYELRDRRNTAREKQAQDAYYRRFRAGCDELRTVNAEKQKKLVLEERGRQLQMNAARRQQDAGQERHYAKMWLAEGRKKQLRHESDVARLNKLNSEQKSNLMGQIAHHDRQKEAERQRILEEKRQIKLQAKEDERLAEIKRQHDAAIERKNQEKIASYNRLRQMAKDAAREAELNDGEALNRLNEAAMRREREEAHAKKMRLKAENAEYLAHVAHMKQQEAQYQIELNKHIQEEVDRGNYKKDMELKRQNDNRARLMADVNRNRRNQILVRENRKINAERQKAADMRAMKDLERQNKMLKDTEGRDAYRRRKQIQTDQLKLIAQKQQKQELERARAIHEREYINGAVQKFDKWIDREKNDPSKVDAPWHGLTKSGWYT